MRRWIVLARLLVCWSLLDFSELALDVDEKDRENLQIWSCLTQKEELELVARSIRQKLHENSDLSYKHFRILLGDVASYQLSLKTILTSIRFLFILVEAKPWLIIP